MADEWEPAVGDTVRENWSFISGEVVARVGSTATVLYPSGKTVKGPASWLVKVPDRTYLCPGCSDVVGGPYWCEDCDPLAYTVEKAEYLRREANR